MLIEKENTDKTLDKVEFIYLAKTIHPTTILKHRIILKLFLKKQIQ